MDAFPHDQQAAKAAYLTPRKELTDMNILIFGPNGSGKGTQGAVVQKKYGVPHIETGVIFRTNIKNGTELGKKAKGFIDSVSGLP